jgi:aminoglycoside 6'-N-acetyltransferase
MLNLRPADISDLELLRRWDEQPHVIASSPNDDWEWETELLYNPEWREQLIAELDGQPVGFVQIIDPAKEESRYWGEIEDGYRAIDIWIGKETDLGKGYGTRMMEQSIARCFTNPEVNTILIDPLSNNTRAHKFYERIGFRFVERRFFGEDDCYVFKLERKHWPG